MSRHYHTLTSHYNGYYYAQESIKEGVQKIERSNKNDYTKTLPIFIYAPKGEAKMVYAEMDKAIEKSTTVIKKHTIVDKKGREVTGAVKWIDENYLTIAIAHFYKHEYRSAIETLDYMLKAYKKDPIRFEAQLWKIRSLCELSLHKLAGPILLDLYNDKEFPKDLETELAAVSADYYMKSNNPEAVKKQLEKSIELEKKKRKKARYAFILGQVHQKDEDNKKALKYYEQCLKYKPAYDMVFAARMKMAKLYDSNSKKGKGIKKELLKMLNDDKNIEYKDEIYYALAEIALKEKNEKEAIENLKLSVRNSVINTNQKGLSYLKLGDICFAQPQYPYAQAYYDSCVGILNPEHPDYKSISKKRDNLTELVLNLNTIQREDSLQALSKLDSTSLYAKIDAMIEELIEEEERKKEAEELAKNNPNANNMFTNQNNISQNNNQQSGSMWYFYNPAAVSFGFSEFVKKWGNRTLEDDWRRSNKQAIMSDLDESTADQNASGGGGTAGASASISDNKTRAFYLQDLPKTEADLAESNIRIVEAYYALGIIYKEKLANNKASAVAYETLLKLYPNNKYELSTYYQLYRIYANIGNQERADYYKNLILNKFPDSEFARIIKNPEYTGDGNANKNVVEAFYNATYSLYSNGNYFEVIKNCAFADSAFTKNALLPKFDFLKALSVGRTESREEYISVLKQITIKYPLDPISEKAKEVLKYLEKGPVSTPDTLATDTLGAEKSIFVINESANHFWILLLKDEKTDFNKIKNALSDLNGKFFRTESLSINDILLDNTQRILSVKQFADKSLALNYFDFIKSDEEIQKTFPPASYEMFIISEENFKTLFQLKNVEAYLSFFRKNYISG